MRVKWVLLLKDPNARNSRARHRHCTQVNLIQAKRHAHTAHAEVINASGRHTTNEKKKIKEDAIPFEHLYTVPHV